MILGTGIDLIEVDRVMASVERFGDRFLNRLLLPPEIAYCRSHVLAGPHIAARFAGKEAISKAFGTGIGQWLGWHDLEIDRRETGEPFVRLHGRGLDLLAARGGRRLHLSLTHTRVYAAAVAVLED